MFSKYKYRGQKNGDGEFVYAYCEQSSTDEEKWFCFAGLYKGMDEFCRPTKCLRSISCEIEKTRHVKTSNWFRKQIERHEQMLLK